MPQHFETVAACHHHSALVPLAHVRSKGLPLLFPRSSRLPHCIIWLLIRYLRPLSFRKPRPPVYFPTRSPPRSLAAVQPPDWNAVWAAPESASTRTSNVGSQRMAYTSLGLHKRRPRVLLARKNPLVLVKERLIRATSILHFCFHYPRRRGLQANTPVLLNQDSFELRPLLKFF